MDYQKIYRLIVDRAKNRKIDGYVEKHHVIPRCLGGSNEKENIVGLSAREHFLCHCLLVKMYPKFTIEWYKVNHALLMMKRKSLNQYRYFNSHLYEYFRKNFSHVMQTSQTGSKNSRYGTYWAYNEELKICKSFSKSELLPNGWVLGRVVNWDRFSSAKEKKCIICGNLLCSRPNVCQKYQTIYTLAKFCGLDLSKKGTPAILDEFDRIVNQLEKDYNQLMMSVEQIKNKYGFHSNERVRCMLRSLGIQRRNLSDAVKNSHRLVV